MERMLKRASFRDMWSGPGLTPKEGSPTSSPRRGVRKTSGSGAVGNVGALANVPQLQALAMQQAYSLNPTLLAQSHVLPKPVSAGTAGVLAGKLSQVGGGLGGGEDPLAKKSRRLIKNRVAAKECRRKKKEYIRDVELKVENLEQVNKSLLEEIDELKKKLAAATNVPAISA